MADLQHSIEKRIALLTERAASLDQEKIALLAEIQTLEAQIAQEKKRSKEASVSTSHLSPERKISIFMQLFRGKEDVFPKRWDNPKTRKSGYAPACFNEWIKGVCNKPHVKCGQCSNQAFVPVSTDMVRKHLAGDGVGTHMRDYVMGIYPMLADETCWFLAADFDKEHWKRDVAAFLETCKRRNVPANLERSRSGNGGHVWIFFSEPIAASEARKMGAAIITETMEHYPEIGFESYDRFFPNQDTMPTGGFGNLIALPLQHIPREKGNSVFLDEQFEPYPDQWAYLSSIRRMTFREVSAIVTDASMRGRILGVRMPLEEEDEKPWEARPSRVKVDIPIDQKLPETVELVFGNQLYIAKQSLPPALKTKLIRLAAFQNPEFYAAQAMRMSTFDKPRIIACAEDFPNYIGLPRGCIDDVLALLKSLGIQVKVEDKRYQGTFIETNFIGKLTAEQQKAVDAMLAYDTGVLAATTAFGKTVIGAYITASRKTNTLILVHRRQLLEQWVTRLQTFLDIPSHQIGTIGGGKRKPTEIIDVALIQSLVKKNSVDDGVANYGQLIVDECHHLSAVSFEAVARAFKGKYVLGLTATATRKDGHHPIIFMQCGPIRYKVDPKKQAALRPFKHSVILRPTSFQFTLPDRQELKMQQLYAALASDEERNSMLFEDVMKALQEKRSPIILTERKDHTAVLASDLSKFCKNVIVMVGGQNSKQRSMIQNQLAAIPESEERLIIATGRYIGEGFDDARLDTLFLAMPISWHGTLAQYAGRLHRLHHAKKEVIIYDYVDVSIPMLAKMTEKRRKGYERLGYQVE